MTIRDRVHRGLRGDQLASRRDALGTRRFSRSRTSSLGSWNRSIRGQRLKAARDP